MPHFNASITIIISILFFALGIFNLFMGLRRLRRMRTRGQDSKWYKQLGVLTGIEYILLGFVLLINLGISSGTFPASWASVVVPLYIFVLFLAAAVMIGMLFQGVINPRRKRSATTASPVQDMPEEQNPTLTPEQRATQARRRRERKRKAAAARRRQSGRA